MIFDFYRLQGQGGDVSYLPGFEAFHFNVYKIGFPQGVVHGPVEHLLHGLGQLVERNDFLRPRDMTPALFMGCSLRCPHAHAINRVFQGMLSFRFAPP
jgi:hypothetical protein